MTGEVRVSMLILYLGDLIEKNRFHNRVAEFWFQCQQKE